MFDVSQFEIEDFAVLTVLDVRGKDELMVDGKAVTIEVWSPGSKQGVRALHKAGQQAKDRLASAFRGKVSKNAVEEAEAEAVEKLVGFTKGINNFPIEGGAQALYSNPKLGYIRKQVEDFLDDTANFSKASIPPSPSTSGA